MILFVNPRATRPDNRRFPLSVMAIGAALPDGTSWQLVDGNLPDVDPLPAILAHVDARRGSADPLRAIAFTVMPGPQLTAAVPLARAVKARCPDLPIVWGGNFPSLYPLPVVRAPYVDFVVRGQGERTFVELLDALEGRRDPKGIAGKLGEVVVVEDDGFTVVCADGRFKVTRVQPDAGKKIEAGEWAKSANVAVGAKFA